MRTWVAVGAGLGIALWWWLGDDEAGGVLGDVRQVFRDALAGIVQGARLTHAPYDKTTGIAPGDPEALAAAAGATLEEYALARNIASEEGNSSAQVQAVVGHATRNAAAAAGKSIASLLLAAASKYSQPGAGWEGQNTVPHSGRFGTQANLEVLVTRKDGKKVHPSDRYASTAQDPYEGHLAVARGVLDGSIPDVTGGATQYDRPSGENDPDAVAAKREREGKELVDLGDIEGLGDLRFWRKDEAAS